MTANDENNNTNKKRNRAQEFFTILKIDVDGRLFKEELILESICISL